MNRILEVNVDDMGFGGVYSLVRNVILAKPAGTTLDIACIEPFEQQKNIDELADHGCTVHYVGYAGNKVKKQFVIIQNLKKLIREGGYEAVHIHGDVAYKLLVYSVAARLSGVNGTGYVSCSDLAADWMFPNVKANKITIIRNGVDLDKFRFDPEDRAAVRKAWSLEDAFVLGHVGRFEYQKNHEYLVDIFAAVKQRVPNAKLFLVGEGSLQEDIRKKVDALGLSDDVIFAGLSREVAKLLSGFDVFVLPSHFEGLPIVGVEAQAAGLPVLFADTITKEAKLTEDSWFLPIGENDVAQWAEKLEALTDAKRGDPYDRLKAQHFSLQDTIQEFLDLYA